MSKLEELIQELCPNGVEYKQFDLVSNIFKGIQFNKKDMHDMGTYPVINGGINPSGYIEQYNQYEDTITISQGGASAGYVNWQNLKFWAGAHCYVLKPTEELVNRFLFHFVKSQEYRLQECQYGAGIPALAKSTIASLLIPVPSLEVQREIVRILDNFTLLTAELTARKKQYEYYRDSLLTFGDDVPLVELRSIIKSFCSGATPTKNNSEYYQGGTIPWIRTQDVRFNEITNVDSFVTEQAVKETAIKWIPENCVIVAISGATAGRCAINKIKATTNQHCLNLNIDANKALFKYIFYCVCNEYDELISRKQGARGDLNSSLVLSLQIPLPTIQEQSRIVKILDGFNALISDFNTGLPAEIATRQKQYEYYRDKLLTFKEA